MTAPAVTAPPIRPAQPGDVATIAALLTDAVAADPVAHWLVPDLVERQHIFHALLAMEVDHAVEWGHVDVTVDMTAVAVWRHHPAPQAPPLSDYHLSTFTGRHLTRFQHLYTLVRRYRTAAAHHWLAWLHVTPHARHRGIGQALLAHHHQRIDQLGYPVDTIATATVRNHLTRHGYRAGTPLRLIDGPPLWPLRRAGRPVPLTAVTG
ncbi:GNAT family N-acetyltransferase [Verrucosispora sp. WMMC514]|uniref:GNAT family N-acetyltransferase n=1 Tax=Verrucosispora sp. WMMC514 TaxID=3015156 RepID=UPI00248B3788|nr:GNAT family N-acetyltransferase [Verrucosispora sp. WMMC514]WBB91520.1 GNAT family N-acetyltransferase [Verrucosispora sp. WMMC514]